MAENPRTVASEDRPRILVLGLGNELLSDDRVGLEIVRSIAAKCQRRDVVCRESSAVGWALLDEIVGFETVIVVDSIVTGAVRPGYLHEIDPRQIPSRSISAPHRVGLPEALKLAAMLSQPLPRDLRVFAVEIADGETFGAQLTPTIAAVVPIIVARICNELDAQRSD